MAKAANEPKHTLTCDIEDLSINRSSDSTIPPQILDTFSTFPEGSPSYLDDRRPDLPCGEVKPLTARQIRYQKQVARMKEQGLKRPYNPRPHKPEFDNNDVIENAPQAHRIITKFGGPTRLHRLAKECGFAVSYQTLIGWNTGKTQGYIPHWAWPMILECARLDGMVLVSEDFDPRPFTLYKPRQMARRAIAAHDVVVPTVGRKKGGKNGEPSEEEPL